MKYILVGDTHFDSKNGNQEYLDNQMKVWYKQIIPTCIEQNIDTIIQMGDITDNRTRLCLNTQYHMMKLFDALKKNNIKLVTIVGNHDIYYKESRKIYSMQIFEKAYDNITIINEQTKIDNMLLVPWLVNDEQVQLDDDIEIVLGHFEMKDFNVTRTFQSTHGLDKSTFKGVTVISGHYHIKQDDDNIHYLGVPVQQDWNDYKAKNGFYIFDNIKNESTFIENTSSSRHVKVTIDIDDKTALIEGFDEDINIKINNKTDYSIFDNAKVKVYAKKELAIVKKFIEEIDKICYKWSLEIISEEIEVDIESRISEAKSWDLTNELLLLVDDDDKALTNELLTKAKELMKV